MASEIDWQAVGIAYILAVITNVLILVGYVCCMRCKRKRKHSKRDDTEFKRLESMRSDRSSTKPLTDSVIYSAHNKPPLAHQTSRQVSLESEMTKIDHQNHSRRKRDYVLKWCANHNLPEVVASVLRDNGFNTAEYLDSLKPSDVPGLGLPNKGTECLLRQALEAKEELKPPRAPDTTAPAAAPRRSSSDERVPRSRVSSSPSGPAVPLLSKSTSFENSSDSHNAPLPGIKARRSKESVSHPEPRSPVRKKPNGHVPPIYIQTENQHGFNGFLSNPGLYNLASCLGREWTYLATELNVSVAKIDHLRADHPHDVRTQIYHMLVFWRDQQIGSKEQIKGALCQGLTKVKRVDIVDEIMQEQVKGSVEKIYSSSIL